MDDAALYRLLTWLSPSYPVGAYTHSHGLEWAVEAGEVTGRAELEQWIGDVLAHGAGRNDAILFAHAHRAARAGDGAALAEICELAAALAPSAERHLETTAQGQAFRLATAAAWPAPALDLVGEVWDGPLAYPVAVAVAAAGHGVGAAPAIHAYLHAFVANLVSAGLRLVPLGHTDGQRAMAALEPAVGQVCAAAQTAGLDDVGGCAVIADLAAMRHETQVTRLFRT
jgi:urease accessory protein